jgi:lsr operon transcriptional repressor
MKIVDISDITEFEKAEVERMVAILKAYYLGGKRQEDIARKMGLSRATVSLLLSKGRNAGFLEIAVKDPFSSNRNLSEKIATRFSVEQVEIVPVSNGNHDAAYWVALRASEKLDEIIDEGDVVGIDWSPLCSEFLRVCAGRRGVRGVVALPLVGTMNLSGVAVTYNEAIRQFALSQGGRAERIYVPAFVRNTKEKDLYMRSTHLQSMRRKWEQLDRIFVAPQRAASTRDERPPASAVGRVCGMYYDRHGSFLAEGRGRCAISLGETGLRSVRDIVCLASGRRDAEAVRGLLKAGLVRRMVLDETTALELLEGAG